MLICFRYPAAWHFLYIYVTTLFFQHFNENSINIINVCVNSMMYYRSCRNSFWTLLILEEKHFSSDKILDCFCELLEVVLLYEHNNDELMYFKTQQLFENVNIKLNENLSKLFRGERKKMNDLPSYLIYNIRFRLVSYATNILLFLLLLNHSTG